MEETKEVHSTQIIFNSIHSTTHVGIELKTLFELSVEYTNSDTIKKRENILDIKQVVA